MLRLKTVNRVLRFFGLVLVVMYDTDGVVPTTVFLELARHYDTRTGSRV